MTELTPCFDKGCNPHADCARFVDAEPEYHDLPSLQPYDQPLSDPCPHFVDRDKTSRGEG
jgi:hypothetical protein